MIQRGRLFQYTECYFVQCQLLPYTYSSGNTLGNKSFWCFLIVSGVNYSKDRVFTKQPGSKPHVEHLTLVRTTIVGHRAWQERFNFYGDCTSSYLLLYFLGFSTSPISRISLVRWSVFTLYKCAVANGQFRLPWGTFRSAIEE
jgi:hypothetical protein